MPAAVEHYRCEGCPWMDTFAVDGALFDVIRGRHFGLSGSPESCVSEGRGALRDREVCCLEVFASCDAGHDELRGSDYVLCMQEVSSHIVLLSWRLGFL